MSARLTDKADKLRIYSKQSEIAKLPKSEYKWEWSEWVYTEGECDRKCAYKPAYNLLRSGLIFREDELYRVDSRVEEYLSEHDTELWDIDVDEEEIVQQTLTNDVVPTEYDPLADDKRPQNTKETRQLTLGGDEVAERVADYLIAEAWEDEVSNNNTRSDCSDGNNNNNTVQASLDDYSRSARDLVSQRL